VVEEATLVVEEATLVEVEATLVEVDLHQHLNQNQNQNQHQRHQQVPERARRDLIAPMIVHVLACQAKEPARTQLGEECVTIATQLSNHPPHPPLVLLIHIAHTVVALAM